VRGAGRDRTKEGAKEKVAAEGDKRKSTPISSDRRHKGNVGGTKNVSAPAGIELQKGKRKKKKRRRILHRVDPEPKKGRKKFLLGVIQIFLDREKKDTDRGSHLSFSIGRSPEKGSDLLLRCRAAESARDGIIHKEG